MHGKVVVKMCSVDKVCGKTCSSLSNVNDRDFQYIQELDPVVEEELVLRLGTELEGNPTICQRHKEKFILNYSSNNKNVVIHTRSTKRLLELH